MKKHILIKLSLLLLSSQMLMAQDLVHYWNFNSSSSLNELLTPTSSKVAGAGIVHNVGTSTSTVEFTSNTGQDFGTLNARNGEEALSHLRFNNPVGGELVFSLPTTGYTDPIIKYVTRRSTQSARAQIVSYTLDGTNYIRFDSLAINEVPTLITLDFSSVTAADNNDNFKIKFAFVQVAGNGSGNNRFDNFSVDGTSSTSTGDVNPPTLAFVPGNNSMNIPTNSTFSITFNEDIKLAGGITATNANIASALDLKLANVSGSDVAFTAAINGKVVTITPSAALLNNQTYYVGVKANAIEDLSGNKIVTATGSTVQTIAVQTIFSAGDIVIVGYRMNNSDNSDEFAFLSLVDILPGTMITFTDGKHTNVGTQCPGGLVWTAPSGGVKKGDVVVIVNDSPSSASVGTLTGASFGLSSGGDQIMVYAGSVSSPTYITALSANEWVSDKPDCTGGSTSKLPSTLADGVSSINLSTAPGNVAGLSVNAYYAGSQGIANISALKISILNPANWISIGSATAAQTWPSWSFLKVAPTVLKVEVINATTLKVIFDRDLDATSATNTANFSNIANLATIVRSENGSASDTLLLTYSTPFTQGSSNTLIINNVKDAANNPMTAPFNFTFAYNSTLAFDKVFYTVKEDAGSLKVMLKLANPTASSVDVVVKVSPWSTATNNDFTLATKTHTFTGSSSSMVEISIPIINDTESENDEYFVLSLENATGVAISGGTYATIYIKDNDKKAPVASKEIELEWVTSFDPATTASTTEAISYEPVTKRIYAISAVQKRVDIIDFSNPAAPSTIKSIDMTPYGGVTSIAAKNGILAVGSPNANEQLLGSVVLFDLEGTFKKQLTVGALPDFVCFTPDGSKILTADEGQPNAAYTVDPEGSVSVINVSAGINNISQSDVTNISFASLNANEATLLAAGIRKTASFSTLAQDLEPEYITVSPDSKKAWVVLQENNAMMEINLENLTIASVWPLGTKDYSLAGNGADFSTSNGEILIANFPVKGYYMPDAIANYTVNGTTYIVTANEGDEKEYSLVNERAAVSSNPVVLDPTKFPNATVLKQTHNLGNFRISNLQGDTDKDGDYDELFAVGSRSFSIFNASTGNLVYDSGDDFEYITAQHPTFSAIFNSNHEANGLKGRSNAKGCEPEALAIAELNGQQYAFVGLERIGGVMVYNITDPANPVYVDYKNNRSTTAYTGDHGPEYVVHVKGSESPDGKDYILVSNEISGTITVFGVKNLITSTENSIVNDNNSFNIYPNPVKGTKLNLSQMSDVTVETINGQKVMEAFKVNSLDVSQFNKGLYILKTAEGFTRKFIVE